jgi:hypothetical protein
MRRLPMAVIGLATRRGRVIGGLEIATLFI